MNSADTLEALPCLAISWPAKQENGHNGTIYDIVAVHILTEQIFPNDKWPRISVDHPAFEVRQRSEC